MLDILKSKWNEILEYMKTEYEISDVSYNIWLKPMKVHDIRNGKIIIVAEEEVAVPFVTKKFSSFFKASIAEFLGETFEIVFISPEDVNNEDVISNEKISSHNSNNSLNIRISEANLNPRYTFNSFVVGESNNFAHAYALKVADAPGKLCNPLFLYGGVGLGKTHLMQSIAHYILEHNEKAKVLYVTSETFLNELLNVIRNENQNQNAVMEFRNKYRNIDVLLIDDIQFIIGKERCQEEFFHTFNTLYESKKQIVISSDKPPKEMTTLEERLKSRFECGLCVDISSPEYETRMAILQKKAELENYNIDDDILHYIASNIISNIRELEGALTKVVAYSKISPVKMDLELAREVLKDSISPEANNEITCTRIIEVVAEHHNITPGEIASKKKSQNIVVPRQIAMYLCRELTEESLAGIGAHLGKRDHTTVIHGHDKIEADMKKNEQLKTTIEALKKKLMPS